MVSVGNIKHKINVIIVRVIIINEIKSQNSGGLKMSLKLDNEFPLGLLSVINGIIG